MAAILFSFIATSFFLVSLAATKQNYRILNCKVTPVGENLESEFRLKASEKGVRIVYLNLKIGNNSYNPLGVYINAKFAINSHCSYKKNLAIKSLCIFYKPRI